MVRRSIWLAMSIIMVISLLLAACSPATAPAPEPAAPAAPAATTAPVSPAAPTVPVAESPQKESVAPSTDMPKYGGTLSLAVTGPRDWLYDHTTSWGEMYDPLIAGAWAKGPAGGYGAKESDYTNNYDITSHYEGLTAESWSWKTLDNGKADIIFKIRKGVRFQIIPGNEASALVNGREMTADDVIYTLQWQYSSTKMYGYNFIPELRTAKYEKTGQWEVTVHLDSAEQIVPAMQNITGKRWPVRPPEVEKKYGSFDKWDRQIGTGPFMLKDYVPGSVGTQIKNPNYWAKDPIGPGKGNPLPYIEVIRKFDIPDASTRDAALRTGKIDMYFPYDMQGANEMRKNQPKLKELRFHNWTSSPGAVYMRIDIPPTNDIRVRKALMMATDFETIRKTVNQGQGEIITFPFMPSIAYGGAPGSPIKGLYIGLNDSDLPASVRELYTYSPDKAKQLLKEAGFPNGFKVDILVAATPTTVIDYLSIYKDMWAKVGVDLTLMIRDTATVTALASSYQHPPLSVSNTNSVGRFIQPTVFSGEGNSNRSMIRKDPTIEAVLDKVRVLSLSDSPTAQIESMTMMRDLVRDYILGQAYAIPTPMAPFSVFWWPWLRGYSGETTIQLSIYYRWATWVWIDQDLKKSMGY